MALLVFGFGSGLFLTVLLDDLFLWIGELKKLIRSQASLVEKVEEVESLRWLKKLRRSPSALLLRTRPTDFVVESFAG